MYKHLGFFLNLLALGLFIPGIYLPMFTLNMELAAFFSNSSISSTLINKELSLITTIEQLWQDKRFFVALLIFAFSIFIPVLKTLMLTLAYFTKRTMFAKKIISFVNAISKWSMADVFVVAIFLAVLSTDHAQTKNVESLKVFGFKMDLIISSETLSMAGAGFYYFTAYCLIALLGNFFSQRFFQKNENR